MTDGASTGAPAGNPLALLLAMARFVLVVDTSLMNVSIASVVEDLDTTVSLPFKSHCSSRSSPASSGW